MSKPTSNEPPDPATLLFQALIPPQPPVQIVITAATYIEYSLHKLLRIHLRFPELLGNPEEAGIEFAPLVRLVCAMGIVPADMRKPLLRLGRVRNRFAHDIETVFDESGLKDLTNLIPPDINVYVENRPRDIRKFQWILMLLCQDLYRLMPEEDNDIEEFNPQDRPGYFGTFVEIMNDFEQTLPEEKYVLLTRTARSNDDEVSTIDRRSGRAQKSDSDRRG